MAKKIRKPNCIKKILYASRIHLNRNEWEYFALEGLYEWPSGSFGFWVHRIEQQDITIRVGKRMGDLLNAKDLASVSEGLAGLIRVAWEVGADWLHITKHDEVFDDVAFSSRDEVEGS